MTITLLNFSAGDVPRPRPAPQPPHPGRGRPPATIPGRPYQIPGRKDVQPVAPPTNPPPNPKKR